MERLLNTREAAQFLGLAKQTLDKWRTHGRGPGFLKVGRAVKYRRDDLEAWLAERAVSSTSAAFALDAPTGE